MDGWNTSFPLGRPIFRCYVSFREGISWKIDYGMGVLNSFEMACRFPGVNRVGKKKFSVAAGRAAELYSGRVPEAV